VRKLLIACVLRNTSMTGVKVIVLINAGEILDRSLKCCKLALNQRFETYNSI
jgi:hypothetical protein